MMRAWTTAVLNRAMSRTQIKWRFGPTCQATRSMAWAKPRGDNPVRFIGTSLAPFRTGRRRTGFTCATLSCPKWRLRERVDKKLSIAPCRKLRASNGSKRPRAGSTSSQRPANRLASTMWVSLEWTRAGFSRGTGKIRGLGQSLSRFSMITTRSKRHQNIPPRPRS